MHRFDDKITPFEDLFLVKSPGRSFAPELKLPYTVRGVTDKFGQKQWKENNRLRPHPMRELEISHLGATGSTVSANRCADVNFQSGTLKV